MTITLHTNILQGSDEWLELRRGKLTASEMHLIMSPKQLKPADNDKSRAHVYELLGQRITGVVEPHYQSDDMLRGHDDEVRARELYREKYAPVDEVGFITRDFGDGLVIGYSPDGLVGDDGILEIKGPRPKTHIRTAITCAVPEEYVLQVQTGLLVTKRRWCDFISYSGGLPMVKFRVEAVTEMQLAIIACARAFERSLAGALSVYEERVATMGWFPTERSVENDGEIVL